MDLAPDVPEESRTRAARALASGDPLGALKVVGPFGGPHALALRGIALAQLGDYGEARGALARAGRVFESDGRERERAMAMAAEAEVALAMRDLDDARRGLASATEALTRAGDLVNAAWARLSSVRCALLAGRVADAESGLTLAQAAAKSMSSAPVRAVLALARAEAHARAMRATEARRAAEDAARLARATKHAGLAAETSRFLRAQDAPIARVLREGEEALATPREVEALLARGHARVVVDAHRRRLLEGGRLRADLARRPVLFAMLEAIARRHPSEIASDELARTAFGVRGVNESHRQRLRVEMGRLRTVIIDVGTVKALRNAYRWVLAAGTTVAVLAPLEPGDAGAIRALLADGADYRASVIATVLGKSPRTIQRALADLVGAGDVSASGSGPARRYARPRASLQIASQMLLLGLALPS